MNVYSWSKGLALRLSCLFLTSFAGATSAGTLPLRPNILFITADDMGLQAGCYDDAAARTPNLDRLAGEGVRFRTVYVTQASCSSSRSSLLTGFYPHQTGQLGLAHRGYSMAPGIPTLPTILRAAGYRTGIIGKLHVKPADDFEFDFKDLPAEPTRKVRHVADKAARFWQEKPGSPWFLYVNYFDPHVPLIPQVDELPEKPLEQQQVQPFSFQRVDAPEVRARIASYYNAVSRLDCGIGLLLERLAETGEADNTVVVFTSDNGPPFSRAKTTCYEAGIRVPLIVRWPGVARAGAVSDAMVSAIDLMPTFRAVAGLAPDRRLPGFSLVSVLRGEETTWRRYLFAQHYAHGGPPSPRRVVRDARYKLILNLLPEQANSIGVDGDPAATVVQSPEWDGSLARRLFDRVARPPAEELYDLEADPDEIDNLAGDTSHRAVLERLRLVLHTFREATGDVTLDAAALVTPRAGNPAMPR